MRRNPFCQAFDLQDGQSVEIHSKIADLHVAQAGLVYLMTPANLMAYCFGRNDYETETALPFADPIALFAGHAGRWFLVSELELRGTYCLRGGAEISTGPLRMRRVTPDIPPAA
jgi:hypothetical protein